MWRLIRLIASRFVCSLTAQDSCIFRKLESQEYVPVWKAMQAFTEQRNSETKDEIWMVEHPPVFTQGQAGKEEHLLSPGDIPVVQVDRGGQITYHGPGQQVVYFLIDLKRKKIGVRALVSAIEDIVVEMLGSYSIDSKVRPDAPGVYVEEKKICSLGLKIKRGCSFHGLALNVKMDKSPFLQINPCGYEGMEITQISDFDIDKSLAEIQTDFQKLITKHLGYSRTEQGDIPTILGF